MLLESSLLHFKLISPRMTSLQPQAIYYFRPTLRPKGSALALAHAAHDMELRAHSSLLG